MQELGKLFGSEERVKIIRLFLSDTNDFFLPEEISKTTKIKEEIIKKELLVLEKSGLLKKIKEKYALGDEDTKNTKQIKIKEYICYTIDKNFRFLNALSGLMFDFENANKDVLLERFKTIGRMKYMQLSGVFVGDDKARCDIMYVGESVKKNIADKLMLDLQAEIGKKLEILILDVEEFDYRYKMFDRLVRDSLKDSKIVLLNKLSI
jgi:hypothetical protein